MLLQETCKSLWDPIHLLLFGRDNSRLSISVEGLMVGRVSWGRVVIQVDFSKEANI